MNLFFIPDTHKEQLISVAKPMYSSSRKLARLLPLMLLTILLLMFACKAKGGDESEAYSDAEAPYEDAYKPNDEQDVPADTALVSPAAMAEISSYQYTWSQSDKLPPMVIIIDDFGQTSGELLQDYAKLPPEIAFAILPDLAQTAKTASLADITGHEVLIHIPMQAVSSSTSPGAKYIRSGMEADEINSLISSFQAQMPNAIAANNHMGSAATADYNTMLSVISKLQKLGVFFLDSATTNKSAVPAAAAKLGVYSAKRDIFLDVPDNSDATLISKIQSLGKYKGRNEPIVVITHCHNRQKLVALHKFITQITDMGIQLVPPSALYKGNL